MASELLLSLIDEEKCIEVVRSILWPDGVRCPECGSKSFWIDREEEPKLQYRCPKCGEWWTDFSGTIFERTHLPVSHWFLALDWFRQGKSALAVANELGVHRHTAERMRNLLQQELWAQRLDEKLSGVVESDEVYISCGEKGIKQTWRNARKRGLKRRGRGSWDADKPPVIGVVQREGCEIRLEVCRNAGKKTATK